ncbi:MAG TPA: hypothetical protein VKW08_07805 [Xanthobacteraceae bacterium]|jgi:hypothetical protein|nr:hypothetical protein [Xanthobacteraceae bacterium]
MVSRAVIAAAALVLALPAQAADRQVAISDGEFMAWSNIGPVMDRCMGAMLLRREFAACADVSAFLAEFSAKVKEAKPAAPAAPPPPSPAPQAPASGGTPATAQDPQ